MVRRSRKPHKGVVAKRSSAGLGLFTTEPIKRDKFVVEYTGSLLTDERADKKGGKYLFEINKNWTIDGSRRDNLARYANHSCKPNCEAELDGKRIFLYSLRDIESGEELTYNYGKEYFDDLLKGNCVCGHCNRFGKKKRKRKKASFKK